MLPPKACPPHLSKQDLIHQQIQSTSPKARQIYSMSGQRHSTGIHQVCLALALGWALWAVRFSLAEPGANDFKNPRKQACRGVKASELQGLIFSYFHPKSASNLHFSIGENGFSGLRATPFSECPPSAHPCMQLELVWTLASESQEIPKNEKSVSRGFALTSKCHACATSHT